jgi:hypothetical protein
MLSMPRTLATCAAAVFDRPTDKLILSTLPFRVVLCRGWRTDTCLPFFHDAYNVVVGKEPRLWNCPPSSCHGAFLDTTNPLEPSHVK